MVLCQRGGVEVIYRPIAIHIRFSNKQDFKKAFLASPDANDASRQEFEVEAEQSQGCALDWCAIPYLQNKITIENLDHPKAPVQPRSLMHEEAHQLATLLPGWKASEPEDNLPWEVLRIAVNKGREYFESNLTQLAMRCATQLRKDSGYDELAAEEVIAFYSESYRPEEIYSELSQAGGNHDFRIAGGIRQGLSEIPPTLKEYLIEAMEELHIELSQLPNVEAITQKILWEDYLKLVRSWTETIEKLESKKMSREKILALLATTPLASWNALAKAVKLL